MEEVCDLPKDAPNHAWCLTAFPGKQSSCLVWETCALSSHTSSSSGLPTGPDQNKDKAKRARDCLLLAHLVSALPLANFGTVLLVSRKKSISPADSVYDGRQRASPQRKRACISGWGFRRNVGTKIRDLIASLTSLNFPSGHIGVREDIDSGETNAAPVPTINSKPVFQLLAFCCAFSSWAGIEEGFERNTVHKPKTGSSPKTSCNM